MTDPLLIGAHLTSPRLGYVHHGIYVGDGRVVHYAGFCKAFRSGPVEEVPLGHFTRGRGYAVQPFASRRFPAESIVRRARSRIGEDGYRFWSNNCEHFVEWCTHGQSRSLQVERWERLFQVMLHVGQALQGT